MNNEKEIEVNDELIARYLSGEASPEEALALGDWLQLPDNKSHFEKFESTWNAVGNVKKPKFKAQQAWSKVDVQKEKTRKLLLGMTSGMIRTAASFILVAAVSAFLYFKFGKPQQNTFATNDKTDVLNLWDQSKITLYHQTTIDYPVEFGDHERKVTLVKGEAFFEVAPDKQKPFIVHTTTADIKVLGTKFNVVAKENQTEISVNDGKVMVYTATDTTILTPGLSVIVHSGDHEITAAELARSNAWAYATHKFSYENTPLRSILPDIEKTYSCKISVASLDLLNCRISAEFGDESAEKILLLIAQVLDLTVKKDGNVYTLEGKGCS